MLTVIRSINSKHMTLKEHKYSLCFGNISKDFTINNIKNFEIKGYVCNFSNKYDTINVSDIDNAHKYLMKKHDNSLIKCLLF